MASNFDLNGQPEKYDGTVVMVVYIFLFSNPILRLLEINCMLSCALFYLSILTITKAPSKQGSRFGTLMSPRFGSESGINLRIRYPVLDLNPDPVN